jgi:hypothetical protein
MKLVEYLEKYWYYYIKENIVKPRNPEIYSASASLNKRTKVCPSRYVTSKWGVGPLMEHTISYCPYWSKHDALYYYNY